MSSPQENAIQAAEAPVITAPLSLVEKICASALSTLQGALFLWAASVLPWEVINWFSVLALAQGAAYSTAAVMLWVNPRWGQAAWKVSALLALLVLTSISIQVFSGGAYLANLYGGLGEGLMAALLAIWALFVLVTLPVACWALVRTRGAPPRLGKLPWGLGGAAILVVAISAAASHSAAQPRVFEAAETDAEAPLQAIVEVIEELPSNRHAEQRQGKAWRVSRRGAAECDAPPEAAPVTLIATFTRARTPGYFSACIQDLKLADAVERLRGALVEEAAAGAVKVDVVASVADVDAGPSWLSMLALRPALDGICVGTRCWMPWQLLARSALSDYQPLSFLGDLKFGVDVAKLRRQLVKAGADASAPTRRVATRSYVVDQAGVVELSRLRRTDIEFDPAEVERSARAAQRHIVQAQLRDGKFRYLLQPFTQIRQEKNFNLARQAGTLLVLCELGEQSEEVEQTIVDGLKLLKRYERVDKKRGIAGLSMTRRAKRLDLGDSALPLVAFTRCRPRVGAQFDETLGHLAAFVLQMQREDGSFAPSYHFKQGVVIEGEEPLYAPGQSILALTLMEQWLKRDPQDGFPKADELAQRRLRAMAHVAREHWPSSLYPFFFVEENWNCLAAREAIGLERLPEYEQFCFDYMAFKSRLILEEDSGVDPAFVGGFGFGNVIPPHNTGAAGLGEALAATIAVKKDRALPTAEDEALLQKVITFLQRQQWTARTCFGCDPDAIGSLSEHTHSPITRIDFVQHAWAAMGHGLEVLSP